MSLLRSYLTPQAYGQAKAEKLRRDVEKAELLDRWFENLTLEQLKELYAAESTADLVSVARRFHYPEWAIPDELKTADDLPRINLDRLPATILEVIAYGEDPEMRPRMKAWWDSLSDEQCEQLTNASEEEAERLCYAWGCPELV